MAQMNELETEQDKEALAQISGKAKHIEINERTLKAYQEEFAKKGLVITKEEDYPQEDFHLVRNQKRFDSIVDPTKGIQKIIISTGGTETANLVSKKNKKYFLSIHHSNSACFRCDDAYLA